MIREQVTGCAAEGAEKVVIIAHSRGTVDALTFAVSHSQFVKESIEAIFLVQGSLRGSALADYFQGEGHAIDDQMPQPYRLLARLASHAEHFADPWIHDGLEGLTHRNTAKMWEDLFQSHPESRALIETENSLRPVVAGALVRDSGSENGAWYLTTYYGKNDGETMLDDQVLPGVGKSLIILKTDQCGLTIPFPIGNTREKFRRTLSRVIFMAVGQPDGENSKSLSVMTT